MKLNALNIGSRITKYRVRNNWTQESLATQVGITTTAICLYERGVSPSMDLNDLEKIADVLGVPLNDILYSQPKNGSVVNFVESTIFYVHEVEYDGKKYVIESSKDISPERTTESRYSRKILDSDGNTLESTDEVSKVLGRALGDHIKKIRDLKLSDVRPEDTDKNTSVETENNSGS